MKNWYGWTKQGVITFSNLKKDIELHLYNLDDLSLKEIYEIFKFIYTNSSAEMEYYLRKLMLSFVEEVGGISKELIFKINFEEGLVEIFKNGYGYGYNTFNFLTDNSFCTIGGEETKKMKEVFERIVG